MKRLGAIILVSVFGLAAPMVSPGAEIEYFNFEAGKMPADGCHFDPLPDTWTAVELKGPWRFQEALKFWKSEDVFTDEEKGLGYWKKDFDAAAWLVRPAPRSWSMYTRDFPKEKNRMPYEGVGWYRTVFEVPRDLAGKRVLLYLHGIRERATVWVNGREIGTVTDATGYLRHTLDITGAVQAGAPAALAVRVWCGDTAKLPNSLRGIVQPVRLVVAPDIYVARMLIDPDLKTSSVSARCVLRNETGRKITLKLTPLVTADDDRTTEAGRPIALTLVSGENSITLTVPLRRPKLWTPETPFLYSFAVRDSSQRTLGLARFGYRQFTTQGRFLLLNGQRIRLRGVRTPLYFPSLMAETPSNCVNEDGEYAKLLLMEKAANINCGRTSQCYNETVLNLADELGFLYYMELPEIYRDTDALRAHVEYVYNHPSVVIWCFGNEEYESWFPGITVPLKKAYEVVHEIDRQGRPVSAASGIDVRSEKIPVTDIADVHIYGGDEARRDVLNLIQKRYRPDMPFMVFETEPGGYLGYWNSPPRGYDEQTYKLRDMFRTDEHLLQAENRRKLAQALNSTEHKLFLQDIQEYWARGFKNLFLWDNRVFPAAAETLIGWMDRFRMDDTLEGFSVGNWGVYEIRRKENDRFIKHPVWQAMRTALNPEYVSVYTLRKNPLAGTDLPLDLRVINDTSSPAGYTVSVELKNADGAVVAGAALPAPDCPPFVSRPVTGSLSLSKTLATGPYTLSLTLLKKGAPVIRRDYAMWVLNNADVPRQWPERRVAVYDSAGRLFAGIEGVPTTGAVLKKLNIAGEPITDFSTLDRYEVLIIGCNSMDAQLADAGEAVARWVEKGGRLLCFEQAFAGTVPWLPQMKLAGGEPLSWADALADQHPIFEGIAGFERWLRWDGLAGVMCKTLIQPVNPSLLAVCAGNRGYGLVLSEVSLGKGIILNSQVLATERFGSDSVATQFVINFLKYGLSREISAYATPFSAADLPVQRQLRLDIDHAGFVDLRPYVNQGFQDEYPGDRKGGWADCGTADMRNIPTGRQRFSLAWYDIINPAANGGKSCIVLAGRAIPGWERLYFPGSVESIKVGTKFRELFMLHTVMYATKEHAGKELFRYILHYEDGTTAVLPVVEGVDITDWHRPKDLPNALVGYQERRDALYISTWKNPYPDKKIETMDIVSAKLAVPIIVAISGRTY